MNLLKQDIFNQSSPNIIIYGHNPELSNYLISIFGEFKTIIQDKISYKNNQYCKI